jgi:hypothetical protein
MKMLDLYVGCPVFSFAPALRDGWMGEDGNPAFRPLRRTSHWAIFEFSLTGESK